MDNTQYVRASNPTGLPKTGQTTSYDTGSDEDYQAGWWFGRTVATNLTRFYLIDADILIDRATGLMWARDGDGLGCNSANKLNWTSALAAAEALDWKGFTDWRLPNIFEIFTISNLENRNPAIYTTEFPNTKGDVGDDDEYWSSTTNDAVTTNAYVIWAKQGYPKVEAKTNTNQMRFCRLGK